MAFKYGAYAYATFIGPISAATTVLGAPEANARKRLYDATLPDWGCNWRFCTDETVPPSNGTSNSYQSTVHYGVYNPTLDVITSATGYNNTYTGTNAAYSIPNNIMTPHVNELVYASTALGFSNANVFLRRVTR